tara:strand:+ start:290 stop:1198 length:909 start_codon:yes stop_codon:yes gene_type:complete
MKILGVNISHHPSICIYENKTITEFYNEDRFILEKLWEPTSKNFKIFQSIFQKIDKVDFVCYASYGRPSDLEEDKIIKIIQNQLNNPPYFFDITKHHIYHALTSFYFSKFEEAVAIIVDGAGALIKKQNPYREFESIYCLNKKSIYPIYKHGSNRLDQHKEFCSDLKISKYIQGVFTHLSQKAIGGRAFVEACLAIGMEPYDAGKLMGLSSYKYSKEKYQLDYDKINIAADVQEKTFSETCNLIEIAKNYGKNILLSGGYFLNCSNNFKYVKKYPKLNFFVDPIPNDAGTCIGACLYYEHYK